jgi:hypothetical protein
MDSVGHILWVQIHHLKERVSSVFRQIDKNGGFVQMCPAQGGFMAFFRPVCPVYGGFAYSMSKTRLLSVEGLSNCPGYV